MWCQPAACWLLESITNSSPSLVQPLVLASVTQLSAPGICFWTSVTCSGPWYSQTPGNQRLDALWPCDLTWFCFNDLQRSSLFQVMTGCLHLVRIISHGTWNFDPTDRRIGEEAIDILRRRGKKVTLNLHSAVLGRFHALSHLCIYIYMYIYTHVHTFIYINHYTHITYQYIRYSDGCHDRSPAFTG